MGEFRTLCNAVNCALETAQYDSKTSTLATQKNPSKAFEEALKTSCKHVELKIEQLKKGEKLMGKYLKKEKGTLLRSRSALKYLREALDVEGLLRKTVDATKKLTPLLGLIQCEMLRGIRDGIDCVGSGLQQHGILLQKIESVIACGNSKLSEVHKADENWQKHHMKSSAKQSHTSSHQKGNHVLKRQSRLSLGSRLTFRKKKHSEAVLSSSTMAGDPTVQREEDGHQEEIWEDVTEQGVGKSDCPGEDENEEEELPEPSEYVEASIGDSAQASGGRYDDDDGKRPNAMLMRWESSSPSASIDPDTVHSGSSSKPGPSDILKTGTPRKSTESLAESMTNGLDESDADSVLDSVFFEGCDGSVNDRTTPESIDFEPTGESTAPSFRSSIFFEGSDERENDQMIPAFTYSEPTGGTTMNEARPGISWEYAFSRSKCSSSIPKADRVQRVFLASREPADGTEIMCLRCSFLVSNWHEFEPVNPREGDVRQDSGLDWRAYIGSIVENMIQGIVRGVASNFVPLWLLLPTETAGITTYRCTSSCLYCGCYGMFQAWPKGFALRMQCGLCGEVTHVIRVAAENVQRSSIPRTLPPIQSMAATCTDPCFRFPHLCLHCGSTTGFVFEEGRAPAIYRLFSGSGFAYECEFCGKYTAFTRRLGFTASFKVGEME
ncbi:hypothetical protein K458DRAFT_492967 [Lentithecium fluviatile CBS 122367]|uniref:Uncharacterized protein n=1 Tax=Lentithecium fluviatile CBS 122367 TaxID=1168545 RepID=A0A6G1ICI4_9PLEO|nr:hypothetical protein K458DRAFT_492967 [Lentithecium fluviatile CBS 122367]